MATKNDWLSWVAEVNNPSIPVLPLFSIGSVEYLGGPSDIVTMFGHGFAPNSTFTVWNWQESPHISGQCGFAKVTVNQLNPSFAAMGLQVELAVTCAYYTGGSPIAERKFGYARTFANSNIVTFDRVAVVHVPSKSTKKAWGDMESWHDGSPLKLELWFSGKKVGDRSLRFYAGGEVVT